MEKIQMPTASKKILAFLGNLCLFLIYWAILAFMFGLIAGVVGGIINKELDDIPTLSHYLSMLALIFDLLAVLFLRKKIFLSVVRQSDETTAK